MYCNIAGSNKDRNRDKKHKFLSLADKVLPPPVVLSLSLPRSDPSNVLSIVGTPLF